VPIPRSPATQASPRQSVGFGDRLWGFKSQLHHSLGHNPGKIAAVPLLPHL
jgi:hypothetical protein